jgi:hypothetical protein
MNPGDRSPCGKGSGPAHVNGNGEGSSWQRAFALISFSE